MALELRILGPLEVLDDGRPVAVGGPRQRAVLVVLLLRLHETVPASRLIDEIWGENPPAAAANVLQGYISVLRKALGRGTIETRGNGYTLALGPRDELDVRRFEDLVSRAEGAQPAEAAALLRDALALWRGPALADCAEEPFARPAAARLEELRLHALELRLQADLAVGRHDALVGELQGLVREHPLRERLRAQLLLALYRSGRQAEALEAYRAARRALVDELGIEPGPALQELERSILRQDPTLDLEPAAPLRRAILVVPWEERRVGALLALAEPLARRPVRDLILARIAADGTPDNQGRVAPAGRRRAATLSRAEPARDVARLASQPDVDLVLLAGELGAEVEAVLDGVLCDIGVLLESEDLPAIGPDRPVVVPFGGADHDWAAMELGAWIAQAQQAPLRLVGASGGRERREASRRLASAALIVQRLARVTTSTLLVEPGEAGLVRAAEGAGLIVFGVSSGRRGKGPGLREAVARAAATPTLLVRKGLRPGGLAPEASLTRFTWSLGR